MVLLKNLATAVQRATGPQLNAMGLGQGSPALMHAIAPGGHALSKVIYFVIALPRLDTLRFPHGQVEVDDSQLASTR